jgi:hypothetical protein
MSNGSSSIPSSIPPPISEEQHDTGIPVACSKCNNIFQSDLKYAIHYNEVHADAEL